MEVGILEMNLPLPVLEMNLPLPVKANRLQSSFREFQECIGSNTLHSLVLAVSIREVRHITKFVFDRGALNT